MDCAKHVAALAEPPMSKTQTNKSNPGGFF